jgi:hypothetical protein
MVDSIPSGLYRVSKIILSHVLIVWDNCCGCGCRELLFLEPLGRKALHIAKKSTSKKR